MLKMIADMRRDSMFNGFQSTCWQQVSASLEPSTVSNNEKTNMHYLHTYSSAEKPMEKVLQVHFENGPLLLIRTPTLS